MEEFSQAVVEERDLVNEKLKMKESEVEQERILRMELCDRLKELQNKVSYYNTEPSETITVLCYSTLLGCVVQH